MNFSLKNFSLKDLSLKELSLKQFSLKTKLIALTAAVLILVLVLTLSISSCNRNEDPVGETVPADTQIVDTDSTTEPTVETQPVGVPATMGTITASKLNIRENAGSDQDVIGAYYKGDRVEIQETKTIDDTVWGYTGKGWIGMGYVKMDGTDDPTAEGSDGSTESELVSDGSILVLGYGVVDLRSLNVRFGPDTEYGKIGEVSEGTRYAYYQEENGWVRIEDGWVSTDYFYIEGTTAEDAAQGTVITDDLNIRTGPSTDFKSTGTYMQGESIEILAQVHGWGYTAQGWVSMNHVELAKPTYTTGTGSVISGLNIRKEPNADSEKVGTYSEGDKVTILEVQEGWGKTDKGWINLLYIKYD